MRRLLLMVVCLGLPLGARTARADRAIPEARIESARGVALGTGMRAAASSSQAQADNPANLVLGGVYHLETFLGYDPTFKRVGVGASVVDSMTSRLAAGASARALFGNNEAGDNQGWEAKLGLAVPLAPEFSLGIAGRYSNLRLSDPRAFPEQPPAEGEPVDRSYKVKHFTMDAAATLRPIPGLAIAALAYNLINTHSPLTPMRVGGSAAFSIGALTVGGDVLVDLNKQKQFSGPKLLVGGGLEYMANGVAPLRIGYAYDQGRAQNFITGGLGFVDPRFGVQLGLRQTVGGRSETTLFFGVQYFVQ